MPTESALSPAPLPPDISFDSPEVLKSLIAARSALAELKGTAKSLPHQGILIDTLFLQEALASSEIENIVTTQDEAFKADLFADTGSPEAREVARYRTAMREGYDILCKQGGISENMLIAMFRTLKQRDDGYRTTPGTVLYDEQTGEAVYKPPQDAQEIIRLMRELEAFINDEGVSTLDPLIRMALIHYQFESIHPFPDGNGRVGRMLNILYLTHIGLLDVPILYLSRTINRTKPDYYRLLQAVRTENAWQEWVIYMLNAVTETAISTLQLVTDIRDLMAETKHRLRSELPKIYSQDLLNNLFYLPYTVIESLQKSLDKSRPTVTSYLKQLTAHGFVEEVKEGRNNYYINGPLVELFINVSAQDKIQAIKESLENLGCKRFSQTQKDNTIYLRKNNWNDYGFETLFNIHIDGAYIGEVKIGFIGQTANQPTHENLPDDFLHLESPFFSRIFIDERQQKPLAHQQIRNLKYLLNDVEVIPEKERAIVSKEQVYQTSLFRKW